MVMDTTWSPVPGVGCGVGEANAKSLGPGQLGGGSGRGWNRLEGAHIFLQMCRQYFSKTFVIFLHQTLVLDVGRAVHCSMN